MKSVSSWLERKLFLKVNTTKTKVVRPARSKYLGFTFLKNGTEWKSQTSQRKEEEIKKEAERISEKRKSGSKTTGSHKGDKRKA